MNIVAREIQTTPHGDGRLNVTVKHFGDNGKEYPFSYIWNPLIDSPIDQIESERRLTIEARENAPQE
jgi:hypothetical protein